MYEGGEGGGLAPWGSYCDLLAMRTCLVDHQVLLVTRPTSMSLTELGLFRNVKNKQKKGIPNISTFWAVR